MSLRQAIHLFLQMPSHIKVGVMKSVGVFNEVDLSGGLHEWDKSFFTVVKQYNLIDRFIYEVEQSGFTI